MVSNDDQHYIDIESTVIVVEEMQDQQDVASGGALIQTFTPPIGYIWKIKSMYLWALPPSGATAGSHAFKLYTGTNILITGRSVYSSGVIWSNSHWETADHTKLPPDNISSLTALFNAIFTSDQPIKIKYDNDTDVNAAYTRALELHIEQKQIQ